MHELQSPYPTKRTCNVLQENCPIKLSHFLRYACPQSEASPVVSWPHGVALAVTAAQMPRGGLVVIQGIGHVHISKAPT
jgi:hypothetical protein